MNRWKTQSLEAFNGVVKEISEIIASNKGSLATVIALHGDLGAGKTTFVQELARIWGAKETVTSPTFVIQKKYVLDSAPFNELVHMDVYRLEESSEVGALGWNELLKDNESLVCVEWAEKIKDKLPKNTVHVYIEWVGEEERSIEIK